MRSLHLCFPFREHSCGEAGSIACGQQLVEEQVLHDEVWITGVDLMDVWRLVTREVLELEPVDSGHTEDAKSVHRIVATVSTKYRIRACSALGTQYCDSSILRN